MYHGVHDGQRDSFERECPHRFKRVGDGFIRSGLTQYIKTGSCCFQYNSATHQWIAQRKIASVYVYCDDVCVLSCVCGMHGIPA